MKAELYISTNRAFKNSTDINSIISFGNINSDIGYFDYTLGDFEKIFNLEDFNVHYFADDTNKSHPIYAKRLDLDNPIDLNDSVLSALMVQHKSDLHFYGPGYDIGDEVGIGRGLTDDEQQYYNIFNNTDAVTLYGKENYYSLLGYWYNRYSYVYNIYTYQPNGNLVDVIDTYKDKYFKNGVIEGIKSYKDDSVYAQSNNLDVSIIPSGRNDENSNYSYMYFYNKYMNKELMRNSMDSVANVGVPGTNFVSYKNAPSPFFQLYNETLNIWSLNMALPICMYREELGDNNLYLSGLNPRDVTYSTPYFFLKDKSGDYWYMKIFGIPNYNNSTTNSVVTPQIKYFNINYNSCPTIVMMRVKDAVTGATGQSDYRKIGEINTYPSFYNFGNDFDCNALLDEVFNPKSGPSYDDGGPDAIGPGDPYEDENNAGEAVGGDANIVDDITPPNMAPNTSYEDYIITNGLYGSYKLTVANLKNYTKTLQLCRDSAWLPGELGDKFENMGNLIQENTVSVFMLPVDIADITSVPFNVGTKAIRNTDVVGNWGEPSSVDTTNLINKYTKEYVYSLGTISHYYDNFLDFAPYSTASLYIPYIGKVEIPINLVQSTSTDQKELSLSIRLNRTNGDILCILLSNNIPLCRWQGNCARSIALSVNDNSAILQNQFSRLVSSFSSGLGALGAAATGNVVGATSNMGQMFSAPMASGAPITTSSHMIGNAPETGDVGWMDSQLITLTVERPIWWKPYDYGELIGYPTRKIAKLSTVSGFARVPNIHIRCSATESEKERLKTMLAEGVLF